MICRGFTLVELLVVITIIVVLLALLAPALDRAIYQADLVRCAANQRVVSTAATNYAFSSKRSYPHRPMPAENTDNWLNPNQLQHPFQSGYDLRPMLRDELGLKINENMQCPLVTPIDLDERPLPDEFIFGNQAMWFGWHYQLGNNGPVLRGMKRLGDRFEWQRGTVRRSYNLLISDYDLDRYQFQQAGHPDVETGVLFNMLAVRQGLFTQVQGPVAEIPHTVSQWWSWESSPDRGPLDMNYGYDDGSVFRVTGMTRRDPRMDEVPNTYNNKENMYYQVPRGG